MQFDGAKISEQGVTFGIVIVKPHVLHTPSEASNARSLGRTAFGAIPVVLMAQDARGIPTYSGRPDIVNFLGCISVDRIPWQRYTLSGV